MDESLGKSFLFRNNDGWKANGFVEVNSEELFKDTKSTIGYCIKLWRNLVIWWSKRQIIVARSSVEAEYKVIAQHICELIWLEKLLSDLDFPLENPMKLCNDIHPL